MIYLVSGKIGGGKTSFIAELMRAARDRGIPYSPRIITDSTFLTDAVALDHQKFGGIHHIHTPGESPRPHRYDPRHEHETFINMHPMMQHLMNAGFMKALGQVKDNGEIVFAEMAIGVNGIPGNPNDYSARRIISELHNKTLPSDWIQKVGLFVLVDTSYELSFQLNEERLRHEFRPGADVTGEMSRPVPREVMPFTQGDDTYLLVNYLMTHHRVGKDSFVPITNDGTGAFYETGVARVLSHANHRGPEGNRIRKERG